MIQFMIEDNVWDDTHRGDTMSKTQCCQRWRMVAVSAVWLCVGLCVPEGSPEPLPMNSSCQKGK